MSEGGASADDATRLLWTLASLTWTLAMLVGVVGVGLFLDPSTEAFVLTACLLTCAIARWLSVVRRINR